MVVLGPVWLVFSKYLLDGARNGSIETLERDGGFKT
jgi:hypothetical protein